ncbi:MAG: hypothetical protein ABI162_04155 [Luteolibacter sp.]
MSPVSKKQMLRPAQVRRPSGHKGMDGMTLLEMTVVILVLLSLVSVLFLGAQAWKRGSDRALCIMHIENVQKGVRSFANLYGYDPGENAPSLQSQIIGLGRFVENTPICPSNGTYSFGADFGNDTIPPVGDLYLQCSLATSNAHIPDNHSQW